MVVRNLTLAVTRLVAKIVASRKRPSGIHRNSRVQSPRVSRTRFSSVYGSGAR